MYNDKFTEIAVSAGILKMTGSKEVLAGILKVTFAEDFYVAILRKIGLSP